MGRHKPRCLTVGDLCPAFCALAYMPSTRRAPDTGARGTPLSQAEQNGLRPSGARRPASAQAIQQSMAQQAKAQGVQQIGQVLREAVHAPPQRPWVGEWALSLAKT
jgi:hypothetical protein